MTHLAASERLIVGLDVPSVEDARALVRALGDTVVFYKVGLELVIAGGIALARELKHSGKRVFLDLKLLDIGNTVERATMRAAELGVNFLTVHGHDRKTLVAAVAGSADRHLKILAVTVLTNLTAEDLDQQGVSRSPAELALHRASLAFRSGCHGVIASGQEAARIRAATGPGFLIVTPGIRLEGSSTDDQERVTTPEQAIAAGADYLVVGRPITHADDPLRMADTFIQHIREAHGKAARSGHPR